jgi:hypothetical protein
MDPNAFNDDELTALMRAAASGQTPTVRALIAGGANVNVQNNAGATALILASARGYTDPVIPTPSTSCSRAAPSFMPKTGTALRH